MGTKVSFRCGDANVKLREIESGSVQCVVTSPPYFGLRDYGIEGQLGSELSLNQYISNLVEVFREVRRVLKPTGTVWLNLGDSYAGNAAAGNKVFGNPEFNKNRPSREATRTPKRKVPEGLKEKDLMLVPHRVAIALQEDGWYVRSDIVWSKPNTMPESCTDRVTRSHEYVFMLSKSKRYYFDHKSIAEQSVCKHPSGNGFVRSARLSFLNKDGTPRGNTEQWKPTEKRRRRSVWHIATKPFKDAHFAVQPEELTKLCILAGSAPGDLVLDPFAGAFTTCLVSRKLKRNSVGIELNPEYVKLGKKRIKALK